MLSERILARYSTPRDRISNREPGLSISGLHKCPYIIYLKYKAGTPLEAESVEDDRSPQSILNMDDGWDQEDQTVRRLKESGIEVFDRGQEVTVGRTKTKGHIDGKIELNGKRYLWEHKAFNSENFYLFSKWGLKYFPYYESQFQVYLKALIDAGEDLAGCCFQVKSKEFNDYKDIVFDFRPNLATNIVEWVDKIKEGWIPEPGKCMYCMPRGEGIPLDFSWIASLSSNELDEKDIEYEQKYRQGVQLRLVGSMLEKQSEEYFKTRFEEVSSKSTEPKKVITFNNLRISKSEYNEGRINKDLVISKFGIEGYLSVVQESPRVRYTFKDLEVSK